MFNYAQIDVAGMCFAVTQSPREIIAAHMISIASFDTSFIGRTYSGGSWS